MIEPLGAKWPPKAVPKAAKADTERSKVGKVRPDVAQQRKITNENCPKHALEQSRTMKNKGFVVTAVFQKEAGEYREANTIRRAPGARRVKVLPEIPVADQT